MSRKTFFAYAGWLDPPEIIGQVYVDSNQGKEHISFEYDKNWLNRHQDIQLDPDLLPHAGRQYCPPGKTVFGFMSDTSPDRWGRTLIDRREIITARKEGRAVRNLQETDYLLSVHDGGRQGAIRFSYNEDGPFESSSGHLEAPPMVYLRKLEQASLAFEAEKDIYEENQKKTTTMISSWRWKQRTISAFPRTMRRQRYRPSRKKCSPGKKSPRDTESGVKNGN